MATEFSVVGPCSVPVYRGAAGKTITSDQAEAFWEEHEDLENQRGCYVFGMRAGRGMTPAYVGLATKSFGREVFTPHKLTKYHKCLVDYRRGTPVLFFLVAPKKAGAPNNGHISELERFLIQVGVSANEDLLNIQGTREAEWSVRGVLRSGKGKRSNDAKQFLQIMKMHR